MGTGLNFKCNCKNRPEGRNFYLGVGMHYPHACAETMQEMRDGGYGDEWRQVVTEYPDGAVDCERQIYLCDKCGHFEVDEVRDYYIPTESNNHNGCCVWDAKSDEYQLIRRFSHICPKCQSEMRIANPEADTLVCPDCHSPLMLNPFGMIMWD